MRGIVIGIGAGALACLQLMIFVPPATADLNFNSSEPGCGTDSTILWCEDFEDGYWWNAVDFDKEILPINDGWRGYYNNVDSIGDGDHALCNGGAVGTSCYGHKGHTGQSVSFGWKLLSREVPELYLRLYWLHDGKTNLEKIIGIGDASTFGGSNANYGFLDSHFANDKLVWCNNNVEPCWLFDNVASSVTVVPNHWYYMEFHFKLGTRGGSNGVYEAWMDDCGTDGRGCTGPGTLRARYTNVNFYPAEAVDGIGFVSLWGWSSSANSGMRKFDQIVARTQRIGPMGSSGGGSSQPPAPVAPVAPVLLP